VGILCWVFREKLSGIRKLFGWLRWLADHRFGFEAINHAIVNGTQATGEGLRVTQTGQLNWNVMGILIGLLAVLATLIIFGLGA
jgi:hypothetical protein